MLIVIDTNIVISCLLKEESKFRDVILMDNSHKFISSIKIIVEIFKHKEKIIKHSKLDEDQMLTALLQLLNRIHFINDSSISNNALNKSFELTSNIDLNDLMFVALALEYDAFLWTSDLKLKRGLLNQGFTNIFDYN